MLVLPVAIIEDAVKNMRSIKTFADNLNEEKRKMIILAFVSTVLFFLPIFGKAVATSPLLPVLVAFSP